MCMRVSDNGRHRDHTGGIASVHEEFPNVKFWQFPRDTNNNFPEVPSLHNTSSNTISACNCSASADTKDSVATASELESASVSGPTILPLQDGQLFPVPGCSGEGEQGEGTPPLSLRIVHCPGHTADHVAVVLEPALPGEAHPVLFTGDCVLGQGSAVFESLSEYLVSLRKLLNSFAGDDCVIYPAHGPVVQNGSAKIKEYIEHRMLREKQIIGVLEHSRQTQEDDAPVVGLSASMIVGIVYKQQNLSELLTKAACHSVLLHLNKLLQDGMVAVDDTAGATSPSERHHQRWRLVHTQPTPKSGML
jgi:glyoxylase-like metal-dependent hydrolase (beta-lactamase superfamily II)